MHPPRYFWTSIGLAVPGTAVFTYHTATHMCMCGHIAHAHKYAIPAAIVDYTAWALLSLALIPLLWIQIRKYGFYLGFVATYLVSTTFVVTSPLVLVAYLSLYRKINKNEPNKAVEPTPVAVTPPANAGAAPSTSAAHL